MNTRWDVLKLLGLDIQSNFAFFPAGDTPTFFDTQRTTARVYNKFSNTTIKYLVESSEQYFGTWCYEIAGKLWFQARNTLHHHILFFTRCDD